MREVATQDPKALMHSIIQRVATGPELSKSISRQEARRGLHAVLDHQVDPVQAGIFLIALRMKRETDEEVIGIQQALMDVTESVVAPVDEVLTLSDPFDGYNRTLPAAPFLPVVLAACGLPTVCTGMESIGPKYGITYRLVYRALGLDVDLTPAQAAARLGHEGWAYCDQAQYAPRLHALKDLRKLMVKRQAITTAETQAMPVRGRARNHFMTGFVHKPYPRIYALLAREAGFDSALIVRGVEGGVIPSLRQDARMFVYRDRGEEVQWDFNAAQAGISQEVRAPLLPGHKEGAEVEEDRTAFDATAMARTAAEAGFAALRGEKSATYDALVMGTALVLWGLGKADSLAGGADRARQALDSGAAKRRLAFERL
ncbi:MAG TPA: anthranilate phosphoribosyltransferase [Thiobacillaceae bacterium]|nr:anthranilate phosphoribosyltransferase [Thiobacillaceae bacterium]